MSTSSPLLLLPSVASPDPTKSSPLVPRNGYPSGITLRTEPRRRATFVTCAPKKLTPSSSSSSSMVPDADVDCVGTATEAECHAVEVEAVNLLVEEGALNVEGGKDGVGEGLGGSLWEWPLLVSPFFFWGTAMVAMKGVISTAGPFFVAAVRLIPAGMMLIGFSMLRGRKLPTGFMAWVSILLFGIVDAACFQGFLAEGLLKTSAGLGSVIIDSQPLTVAILAAILFGESIGLVGAIGLVLGVIGLLLLELPAIKHEGSNFSIWGSGEWWMLLAAQSMAVGTVMVRWVSKYSDPIMATGWHMILGGVPLMAISILNHDPATAGGLTNLTLGDCFALLYSSVFGSAISYGVFFYNATRGSLIRLSSLTFLTPMFAALFGFLLLDETFSPLQLGGAFVTLVAIYMVNYRRIDEKA